MLSDLGMKKPIDLQFDNVTCILNNFQSEKHNFYTEKTTLRNMLKIEENNLLQCFQD